MRMTIVSFAILILAACGGGGGGGGNSFLSGPGNAGADLASIRTLTGTASPTETLVQLNARAPGILARADSMLASSMYGNSDSSELPTFLAPSTCSGTSCTWTEPNTGIRLRNSLSNIGTNLTGEMIGTKHGVTVRRDIGSDYWSLASWLDHSAVGAGAEWDASEGVRVTARYSLAGGDRTGSRPSGNATWQGLMVGTPATGAGRGDRLLGDATLTYDSGTQMLDARFTNIQNIDRLQAHSVPTIGFMGVPVGTTGSFVAGTAGNRIQGELYGPNHAEAAGVFEQLNIVGAFGTKIP